MPPTPRARKLVSGAGCFLDDLRVDGALDAVVVRSPHAAARLQHVDTRQAMVAGAALAWAAEDLGLHSQPLPLVVPHPALRAPRTEHPLAKSVTLYAGQPVALVVAQGRPMAHDLAEYVDVQYAPQPMVASVETALRPDAPCVHDDLPGNVSATLVLKVGDWQQALAAAPRRLQLSISVQRSAGQPLETRGVLAVPQPNGGLCVYASTQAPTALRLGLARLLTIPEDRLRVIAPDVGGGFGTKSLMYYPEEVLIPLAALHLGRPVRWVEGRSEHFLASHHERGQLHEVDVGFDEQGRILALTDRFVHDSGAYTPYGLVVPLVTSVELTGPYRVPAYHCHATVVYTNTVPVTPYRGAGRPQACFVMERTIGAIAKALVLPPEEVRRRNLLAPSDLPHATGLTYQDGQPMTYQSGDFPAVLAQAWAGLNGDALRAQNAALRASGRWLGVGSACYVEGTAMGPMEAARVAIDPSGVIRVEVGGGDQGQDHANMLTTAVVDVLTVDRERVTVTEGDSQVFPWGKGTFASRAAVLLGNATHAAAVAVREKALLIAARLFEVGPEDLQLRRGRVMVRGVPEQWVDLGTLALLASPVRRPRTDTEEAMLQRARTLGFDRLLDGLEPGLEAVRQWGGGQSVFGYGAHAAVVEVEPESGKVRVLRYVVAHDCGRVLDYAGVVGQLVGGVAQGIGGSLYERLIYDDIAQLKSVSFLDFHLPKATDLPVIEVHLCPRPTDENPLGVRGVGEAGVIAPMAVLIEAIEDALSPLGVRLDSSPILPEMLWQRLGQATCASQPGIRRD